MINAHLHEKGRIYIPKKVLNTLSLKDIFAKYHLCDWHRGKTIGYFQWLIERIGRVHKSKFYEIENIYRDYYEWLEKETGLPVLKLLKYFKRKNGWGEFLILAKVRVIRPRKARYNFLIVYNPAMYPEVEFFLSKEFVSKESWISQVKDSVLIKLDRAGKITIPKDHREHAKIDLLPRSRTEYVDKGVLVIKKDFLLEIWDPHIWKTAPEEVKQWFNNKLTPSVFHEMERVEFLPG